MSTLYNTDSVIDSRDIIERIEKLASMLESFHDDQETTLSFEYALQDAINFEGFEAEYAEYIVLKKLAEQCEGYGDWGYGETLISEDYFTDYIRELIDCCYEVSKGVDMSAWPYRHMSIDYEAAADEAKQDYMEVDYDGNTYLMRAC